MNSNNRHIVIVGGGQAGAQVIDSLRRRDSTDDVTLVSDENVLPYQRPPLSNNTSPDNSIRIGCCIARRSSMARMRRK